MALVSKIMLDTSLFSYCVWGKPPITIIMMMTGTMMMMMTISPFVAASVWVITVLFHCVCVCARVRDVDVCWMSVEMGWILLAVFFYIHCVLAFFFLFPPADPLYRSNGSQLTLSAVFFYPLFFCILLASETAIFYAR